MIALIKLMIKENILALKINENKNYFMYSYSRPYVFVFGLLLCASNI